MAEPITVPGVMGYALLDAGVHRRLERFGGLTVDRPAPGASGFRLAPDAWAEEADLRFDAGTGWSGAAWPAAPWSIQIEGLTMELRPTSSGGLGVYPEHASSMAWLEAAAARQEGPAPPQVLNLFAHTGLASLALARAGASVVHVDGAKSAVAWARRNAELSGLADRPIRWIVDDAAAFVDREARRGRRYDGIVLDPPAFGRAGRREWKIGEALSGLLAACARIATENAFVLLSAHTTGLEVDALGRAIRESFDTRGRRVESVALGLEATSGARLELGWAVRLGA